MATAFLNRLHGSKLLCQVPPYPNTCVVPLPAGDLDKVVSGRPGTSPLEADIYPSPGNGLQQPRDYIVKRHSTASISYSVAQAVAERG